MEAYHLGIYLRLISEFRTRIWEADAMDTDKGELENEGVLFADPTFVPSSSEITRASCRGSLRIAANYTTLVFNREGHAMCGDCLYNKFEKAKRARWRAANEERPHDANTDNIRVGCSTMEMGFNLERIFPVTPSLKRVPLADLRSLTSLGNLKMNMRGTTFMKVIVFSPPTETRVGSESALYPVLSVLMGSYCPIHCAQQKVSDRVEVASLTSSSPALTPMSFN
ncbi:hypothetical protein DFS34DRAFT_671067 [Phlyctochytrium arcticum]|nr:hypothetical protein DFS34DRAFT_671067 [Phlyctochytrium arcticum]